MYVFLTCTWLSKSVWPPSWSLRLVWLTSIIEYGLWGVRQVHFVQFWMKSWGYLVKRAVILPWQILINWWQRQGLASLQEWLEAIRHRGETFLWVFELLFRFESFHAPSSICSEKVRCVLMVKVRPNTRLLWNPIITGPQFCGAWGWPHTAEELQSGVCCSPSGRRQRSRSGGWIAHMDWIHRSFRCWVCPNL